MKLTQAIAVLTMMTTPLFAGNPGVEVSPELVPIVVPQAGTVEVRTSTCNNPNCECGCQVTGECQCVGAVRQAGFKEVVTKVPVYVQDVYENQPVEATKTRTIMVPQVEEYTATEYQRVKVGELPVAAVPQVTASVACPNCEISTTTKVTTQVATTKVAVRESRIRSRIGFRSPFTRVEVERPVRTVTLPKLFGNRTAVTTSLGK